ncbi:uncharacterized protein LOC128998290 isoform X2 [Macrosteles quadrilineatus]|nr:uncharacterized protein LOC128998290 isoform X2 [Macrosteles quadrilineatus]
MTKEEAMMHYVEELRKIVETMSYNDNVATFLNSLDNFYENVPAEDLELLVGPIIEKIRSRPNSPLSGSPLASRDTSPSRTAIMSRDTSPLRLTSNKHITSSLETSPSSSYSASPLPPDTDDEDDHFLDTQTEPDRVKENNLKKPRSNSSHSVDHVTVEKSTARSLQVSKASGELPQNSLTVIRKDMEQIKNRLHSVESSLVNKPMLAANGEAQGVNLSSGGEKLLSGATVTSEAFRRAIENMTKEVENLQRRMATLETRRQQEASVRSSYVLPRWWGLPLHTTAFLIAWPILVIFISRLVANRRKH